MNTTALSPEQTAQVLPYPQLAQSIRALLTDPSVTVPARIVQPLAGGGSLFVMPAADARVAITKLITFVTDNAQRELPAIQGDVVVFDVQTGQRIGLLDGPTVTARRTAAVSLLAAQLLGLNAQAWQARHALTEGRAAIRNILLSTFPATPVVVDAPRQMERSVSVLGQHSGQAQSRDLERLLEAFGTLTHTEYSPTAIEFIAGELRLSMQAAPAAIPESLRTGLQARGLRVRQDGNTWIISP